MAASAALAVMAASSATGAYAQSRAQKAEANFKKAQGEQNARLADMQAADAEKRGNKEANNYMRKVRGVVGSQRAALAASGVDIGSGSALELQADTEALGEYDAAVIRNNAAREAWGYQAQATNFRNQAKFDYMAGKYASRNTLLTGGMQAASYGAESYSKYRESNPSKPTQTTTVAVNSRGQNKNWNRA
jgi:hypothetical protein